MRLQFDPAADGSEWRSLSDRVGLTEAQSGHMLMLLMACGVAAQAARTHQARRAANQRWHGGNAAAYASASGTTEAGGRTTPDAEPRTCSRTLPDVEGSESFAAPAPPPAAPHYFTPPLAVNKSVVSEKDASASEPGGDVCVFTSSLREENTHTEEGEGGGKAAQTVASRVIEAYEAKVCPAYPATPQAVRNVSYWLGHGHTEAEMLTAVDNYAFDMKRAQKSARYRKAPVNFFSRNDPTFTGYTKPRVSASPPRPVERPKADEGPPAPAGTFRRLMAARGIWREVS